MGSPFPGMDPFLEHPAWWQDFHLDFIVGLRTHLNARLPAHYSARAHASSRLIEVDTTSERLVVPDVVVTRDPVAARQAPVTSSTGTTATAIEPVTLPLPAVEEVREQWVEIVRLPDRELVGVIEVLSRGNKIGGTRGDYLAKRASLLRQSIHLIELDLLLGGARLPMLRPLPPGDYFAFVSHADRRPYSEVYAWRLRDPLPTVQVPLRYPDPDVSLDLADVFRVSYERGAYQRDIYRLPPVPAVPPEDIPWVMEVPAAFRRV